MYEFGYHRIMQGKHEFVIYREDTTIRVWYGVNPDNCSGDIHSSVETNANSI